MKLQRPVLAFCLCAYILALSSPCSAWDTARGSMASKLAGEQCTEKYGPDSGETDPANLRGCARGANEILAALEQTFGSIEPLQCTDENILDIFALKRTCNKMPPAGKQGCLFYLNNMIGQCLK